MNRFKTSQRCENKLKYRDVDTLAILGGGIVKHHYRVIVISASLGLTISFAVLKTKNVIVAQRRF